MKRAIIGGFIALIGSIWALAIILLGENNLVSSWATPPGRFLTSISQMGVMIWFVIALIFLTLGIALMLVEYFRKDK